MSSCTLSFSDPKDDDDFTTDRNKNQLFLFMIFTFCNILHHVLVTYQDLVTDKEPDNDDSDMDYWIHTVNDVIVILYAIISYRFKRLRQYLMIVFYFFLCL